MLTNSYRKLHTKECMYGRKCCTTDNRPSKYLRRHGRKIEKRMWKREAW